MHSHKIQTEIFALWTFFSFYFKVRWLLWLLHKLRSIAKCWMRSYACVVVSLLSISYPSNCSDIIQSATNSNFVRLEIYMRARLWNVQQSKGDQLIKIMNSLILIFFSFRFSIWKKNQFFSLLFLWLFNNNRLSMFCIILILFFFFQFVSLCGLTSDYHNIEKKEK